MDKPLGKARVAPVALHVVRFKHAADTSASLFNQEVDRLQAGLAVVRHHVNGIG